MSSTPVFTATAQGTFSATREIFLSGELGRRFGRVHRLAVDSPAEAIRALCSQLRGFRNFLEASGEGGLRYQFLIGDKPMQTPHDEAVIVSSMATPYTIAPVIVGSKSVLGTILTGVALVGLGALTGGAAAFGTLGAAWSAGAGATFGYFAAHIGVAMVLGGLAQAVAPTPDSGSPEERPENKPGFAFNGPVNTMAQGHPVPLAYGRLIVGSAVISGGSSVGDIAA